MTAGIRLAGRAAAALPLPATARRLPRRAADAAAPPAFLDPRAVRSLHALLVPALDATRRRRAADALAGRFHAVGEVHRLGDGFDWRRNPSADKEWLIEHHKLPVLVDLALMARATGEAAWRQAWAGLVGSWLAQMGTGELATSDAQVEAKRLEHWLVSLAVLQDAHALAGLPAELLAALRQRLGEEAAYVLAHLRPARNHRTFQLFAAYLVGAALPDLPDAPHWRATAHALLCENLLRDFGEDGVHVELSSHYHQITLETAMAFALLADEVGPPVPPALDARLRQALRFSQWLQLPDGEMPLIGDADLGDHRRLLAAGARRHGDAALAWLATDGAEGRAPRDRSAWFAAAGYLCARDGWRIGPDGACRDQHLFADFGALGEGSHAHYDLFNVCYSVGGRQLLVDPGRYTYHAEPDADGIDWRHAFKRTAAHNTVAVDGRDQTRYLSKARRPAAGLEKLDRERHPSKHGPAVEVHARALMQGARTDWIRATAVSHEYAPRHGRLLVYVQRQYLLVVDTLEAGDALAHRADLHLHLDAAWLGRVAFDGPWAVRGEGWAIRCFASEADARPRLQSGWVSRTYGRRQPAPVLHLGCDWRERCTFVTAVGPAGAAWAIDAMRVQCEGDGTVHVAVDGHDRRGAWSDRFVAAAHAVPVASDAVHGRAALWHERRRAGTLDHLVVGAPAGVAISPDLVVAAHPGGHFEC